MYRLKGLQSRAASAENPTGGRSCGGLAGGGHKGAPCLKNVQPGETVTLMEADGPGMIRHIWCTFPMDELLLPRALVLRIYWDGQPWPSVEAPVGDFFGIAHARKRDLVSELFSYQNARGLNCWAQMPFRRHARVTIENQGDVNVIMLFYQIDYTLGDALDDDTGYFHARFRRDDPCPIHQDYEILDGVRGRGVYLGTVLGVRSLYTGSWWGEGEVKFYIDGESTPTICGTGTEDYIGFAWGLGELCTPLQGCPLCDDAHGYYSIYRLHTRDPIYFEDSLRVTIQQMGFGDREQARAFYGSDFSEYPAAGVRNDVMCYYDRSDDICSVAYWYQTLPSVPFPELMSVAARCADLELDVERGRVRRADI